MVRDLRSGQARTVAPWYAFHRVISGPDGADGRARGGARRDPVVRDPDRAPLRGGVRRHRPAPARGPSLLPRPARGAGASRRLLALQARRDPGAAAGDRRLVDDAAAPALLGAQAPARPAAPGRALAVARRPHLPRGGGAAARGPAQLVQGAGAG